MSETEEITVLKLIDGTTIVGKVEQGANGLEIEHPIELISHIAQNGPYIGEQISLRPWIAMSSSGIFTIDRVNVLAMTDLDTKYIKGYNNIVQQTYLNEKAEFIIDDKLPPSSEYLDQMEDLDMETIQELADAILKKKIH
tara:strand:- start:2059 stop:2478 length:420 start_codon:yes stop_codon:yes gene_type:complete